MIEDQPASARRWDRFHSRFHDSGLISVGFGSEGGEIIDANDAFLDLIGRSRDDYEAGRINWRELTAPEYADADAQAVAELRMFGACRPYEKEYVLPDRRVPIQVTMALCDPGDPDSDHFAVIVDLSDQKAVQAALARSRDALEAVVAKRTAELARANARARDETTRREAMRAALHQSQKLEALGQLTSGIAHDFNNVLAAVAGGFTLIQNRSDEPKIRELARLGAAATAHGTKLIAQLLAYSRQEKLAPVTVAPVTLLADLRPMIGHALTAANTLVIDCPEDCWPVFVDGVQLESALLNLAANARDAMPGGGTLTISARACPVDAADRPFELRGRDAVALRISDTGQGMAPDVLQRVLEPFFTTKAPGSGTGLGLAMVHGFVEQSGGALRIESVVGSGTTFTLFLPRGAREDGAVSPIDELPPVSAAPGTTILVVDDDRNVAAAVAAQLHDLGYETVVTDGGAAALAATAQQRIDLILSDVEMPDVDGVEMFARLRAAGSAVPVLFMSAHRNLSQLAGEASIDKPFTQAALGHRIAAMLGGVATIGTDDILFDKLVARIRAPALADLLDKWRGARRVASLPTFADFAAAARGGDVPLNVVDVDVQRVPITFTTAETAIELALATTATAGDIDFTARGDEQLGSREGAYRRAVRTQRPTYDHARFDFGDGKPVRIERLVFPCADRGIEVDRLIVAVLYDNGMSGTDQ